MIQFSVKIVITACQPCTVCVFVRGFQNCDREGKTTNEQIKSKFREKKKSD